MNTWSLGQLADAQRMRQRLEELGFAPSSVAGHVSKFVQVAESLLQRTRDRAAPASAWFVPGRVEVFGKHTDYAGGRSVVAPAEQGFCGIAVPRQDSSVCVLDAARHVETVFDLSAAPSSNPGSWQNYPATVVRRMTANFPTVHNGAMLAFSSDLPPAAGMSSSSALMILTFLLYGDLHAVTEDPAYRANIASPMELASYLGTVENGQSYRGLRGDRGVGTFGGSQDHAAILCAQAEAWTQFSYSPMLLERVIEPPAGCAWVIGVSGVLAEKTGAACELYNRAALRAREVTELWCEATQRSDPHLAAIIRSSPDAVTRLRRLLADRRTAVDSTDHLESRFEQFVTESEVIIPAIPTRWDEEGMTRLGELADQSQRLANELLGNQIAETTLLARSARQLGAVAASAQGAGFGGSVWALVREQQVEEFSRRWSDHYLGSFPQHKTAARFFVTRPGLPATSLGETRFQLSPQS